MHSRVVCACPQRGLGIALVFFFCVLGGPDLHAKNTVRVEAQKPAPTLSLQGAEIDLSTVPARRGQVRVPDVPMPDPSRQSSVSLQQILVYANSHAPALLVERARSRRGEAEIEAASLILKDNPELGLGLGGRQLGSSTYLESELSIEQQIEIAGERGLRIEAAERGRDVAFAELDETRWQVLARVHALFLDALVARERVDAAQRVVRFAEELQQVAQRRVDAGDDAPLSMLVARADLAQAQERLLAARQVFAVACADLAEVSGWPAGQAPSPRGALPAIREVRGLPVLVRLAAEHHPALRTQALAIVEAESRVRLQEREAWPEPTVGLAYGREGDPSQAPNIVLFTVGLPIPLWERNQGERARATVALGTARARQESLGLRLQAQIASAAVQVNAAAQRVEIYGADVVPAMERNLELIRRAYDLGEIDIHAVSQTRERVLETQSRAIDARSEYFKARIKLVALLGTELNDSALQEIKP